MKTLKKAVDSGQIRQFTGNDYAPLLAKGDILACAAWSGDMVQLAGRPSRTEVGAAEGRRDDLDRQHADPEGRQRVRRIGADELVTTGPRSRPMSRTYVNYICPVVGADKVLEKSDPAVAKNPLIFPTPEMLANAHQIDPRPSTTPSTSSSSRI